MRWACACWRPRSAETRQLLCSPDVAGYVSGISHSSAFTLSFAHLHFSRLHHHTSNHGKILLSFGLTVMMLWLSRVDTGCCYWMFPVIHRHFTEVSRQVLFIKAAKKIQNVHMNIFILASWKCSHFRSPENQELSLLSKQNIFTAKHTSQQ